MVKIEKIIKLLGITRNLGRSYPGSKTFDVITVSFVVTKGEIAIMEPFSPNSLIKSKQKRLSKVKMYLIHFALQLYVRCSILMLLTYANLILHIINYCMNLVIFSKHKQFFSFMI